eukprot:2400730-Rhodomonas_salina.1
MMAKPRKAVTVDDSVTVTQYCGQRVAQVGGHWQHELAGLPYFLRIPRLVDYEVRSYQVLPTSAISADREAPCPISSYRCCL